MSDWYQESQKRLNKNKIVYPQEFVEKVLLTFPEDEEIKSLVEDKSFLLGEYLQRIIFTNIDAEEIYSSYENRNIDEIVKKSHQITVAKELFVEFIKLYDEQYRSKGNYIDNGLVGHSTEVLFDYKVRHGKIKIKKVKLDPVAESKMNAALVRRLEQNEARRREGERIAGEFRPR